MNTKVIPHLTINKYVNLLYKGRFGFIVQLAGIIFSSFIVQLAGIISSLGYNKKLMFKKPQSKKNVQKT